MNHKQTSKHILLFGGAFNPVHKAHVMAVEYCLKENLCDELWIVPAHRNNIQKLPIFIQDQDRIALLKVAFKKLKVKIINIEMQAKEPCKTIDTLLTLQINFPHCKFSLLIGYDQYLNFSTWTKYEELLLHLQHLYVLHRPPTTALASNNLIANQSKIVFLNNIPINISSFQLRHGENLDQCPQPVLAYMHHHFLYERLWISKYVSALRLQHILAVVNYAHYLAIKHKINPYLAQCAAYYHDIAKELPLSILNQWLTKYSLATNIPPGLKHQTVSALMTRETFLIYDAEILSAIQKHTSAGLEMTTLDKLIYCADKLCSGREKEVVNIQRLRQIASQNLDQGFLRVLKMEHQKFLDRHLNSGQNNQKQLDIYKKWLNI